MSFASEKSMFEIYREKGFNRKFKLIIYTELNEHNKETEINRALDGDTVFDGFLKDSRKEEAKKILKDMISEMNMNENTLSEEAIREKLSEYLA
ncbi:MAG: hypothetical protein K1X86_04850 [Ignavibacteria bacterium]|nr:hypothetical protein [Ignavibacteria bacterium]